MPYKMTPAEFVEEVAIDSGYQSVAEWLSAHTDESYATEETYWTLIANHAQAKIEELTS